jgi:hypothetical protein
MTLIELARIYTDLVKVDDQVPPTEYVAKDEIGCLRTKYHQLFMDKLTEEGVEFSDRFDAMYKAFDLLKEDAGLNLAKSLLQEPLNSNHRG